MTDAAPGRVLTGRYRLDGLIARGGMASVWMGQDELLGRRVAVKTLHPDLAHDDALRARFRQEALAAAGLTHPNIVATYDTGEDAGTAFIVMELVEGESLRQLLDRRRVLDPPEAVSIAIQVAAALEHAHRQGVVHRDVKPANILVPREGAVKVTDFGIAKATGGSDLTRTGTVVGTARYLSPEQVQGQTADARTDVYALGLVLYEMLAGHPAYAGDTEMATALARLTGPPTPLELTRPGIPDALAGVVAQALQADPAHRVPSAAALAEALRRAERGVTPAPVAPPPSATGSPATSSTARTTTRTTTRPAPRRRHPGRVLAFLLFLAVLGVAAGLVTARIVTPDDGPGGPDGPGPPPAVRSVADFDPGGDGTENPDAVRLAVDGDPSTAWRSETYATRNLGGLKPGVGLVITLDAIADVSSVEIDGAAGADVEIYVADEAGVTLAAWGPVRARAENLPAAARVPVDPSARGRVVLVWFTRTPESGRIDVAELRVS
ncbi:MAG: protein kinase domain-containing protein [Actinomycetota bacterium]